MRKIVSFIALCIAIILMSSCNLRSQPAIQKCLVGTWQLSESEAFARAVLPPGSVEQDWLEFVDAGGVVGYSFDSQGKVFVDVIAWMSQMSVQVEDQTLPLDMNMIGDASGTYQLDGDKLKVKEVGQSNLAFEAFLDGMLMMRSLQVEEFAPLFSKAYSVAQVECNETTLRLNFSDQPEKKPIVFTRVTVKQGK